MVDFKGLDDMVVSFEEKLSNLTEELEDIKKEIERVKKEYHDEANPHNQGIREYILEKANGWGKRERHDHIFKDIVFQWAPAEDAVKEIDFLSDVMKRKLNKKSVVLFCRCYKIYSGSSMYVAGFYFTDDRLIYTTVGTLSIFGDVTYSIPYNEIKDINIGYEFSSGPCLKVSVDSGKRYDLNAGTDENTSVLNTLLWDIYEFING